MTTRKTNERTTHAYEAARKAAREELNKLPPEEQKKWREAEATRQKRMDETAYY